MLLKYTIKYYVILTLVLDILIIDEKRVYDIFNIKEKNISSGVEVHSVWSENDWW